MIDAQLTSPNGAVCPWTPISFICQQTGRLSIWEIDLPSTAIALTTTAYNYQVGATLFFDGDPRFQLHVVSNTSNMLTTELQATAVRELNGVTVVCLGASGRFMSVIQVASVGKLNQTLMGIIYS